MLSSERSVLFRAKTTKGDVKVETHQNFVEVEIFYWSGGLAGGGRTSRQISHPLTYVDQFVIVSLLKVIEDGSVVEVGQVGHVLVFLVLGRVHLSHFILLEVLGLDYRDKIITKKKLSVTQKRLSFYKDSRKSIWRSIFA